MSKSTIAVAEHFYSIQGEGQTTGAPSYFLRLAGCNLMCGGKGTEKDGKLHNGATWRCDSIEVWLKGRSKTFPFLIDEMGGCLFIRRLQEGAHLIITGGEPMLQEESIMALVDYFHDQYEFIPTIEIETNGTILPCFMLYQQVDYWNVSPKLANSGESADRRINPKVLDMISHYGKNVCFKFVVSSESDMEEIERDYLPEIRREQVWLMPAADTREQLESIAPYVVDLCKEYGFNYSHRVHISVWNRRTGV